MAKKKSVEEIEAGEHKRAKDQFEYNFTKWEPIYKEGDIDMRYRAGQPWEDTDKRQREDAGRQALSFDELSQYRNQAVNDVRANPVSPKFNPTGDGANDQTARFYEGLSRETDYRSNAKEADTTAFENAIDRSFGYERIKVEYQHPKSFLQQLTIEAMPNPACFYPDFDAKSPSGKDWMNADYIESYTREEFKRTFPGAQYQDFSKEQIAVAGVNWMGEDSVQVSEHWDVEMREGVVQQYQVPAVTRNGIVIRPERFLEVLKGVDPKPRGAVFVQERVTEYPVVRSCFTNGLEILEKGGKKWHDHAGDWIPFTACYGAVLYRTKGTGAEREILSMIRLARQPYMAYCYAVTSLVEAIGMITKNPYFAYEGMLDQKQMDAIAQSLHEPVAVLLSKPFLKDMPQMGLLPMLQRNPLSMDIGSYLGLAELCRRAIQAAMGWTPLPTQAQRQNEKSGIALQRIEESGQKGSFHFKDHYYEMVRRRGEIAENLWDRIMDTPQDVVIRQADNTPEIWRINDKRAQSEKSLPSIKGRHSVTIDIGPEYASERDAANTFIDQLIASPLLGAIEPAKRDKIISLGIKARNIGVMGDKIADVISPPENSQNGQQNVEQLKAALQQGAQLAQAQAAEIQELKSGLAAKQLETQSRERIAAAGDETKRVIAEEGNATKLEIAAMQAKLDLTLQQMDDRMKQLEILADAAKVGAQATNQERMAERGHQHTMESQSQSEATQAELSERSAEQKRGDA